MAKSTKKYTVSVKGNKKSKFTNGAQELTVQLRRTNSGFSVSASHKESADAEPVMGARKAGLTQEEAQDHYAKLLQIAVDKGWKLATRGQSVGGFDEIPDAPGAVVAEPVVVKKGKGKK